MVFFLICQIQCLTFYANCFNNSQKKCQKTVFWKKLEEYFKMSSAPIVTYSAKSYGYRLLIFTEPSETMPI